MWSKHPSRISASSQQTKKKEKREREDGESHMRKYPGPGPKVPHITTACVPLARMSAHGHTFPQRKLRNIGQLCVQEEKVLVIV